MLMKDFKRRVCGATQHFVPLFSCFKNKFFFKLEMYGHCPKNEHFILILRLIMVCNIDYLQTFIFRIIERLQPSLFSVQTCWSIYCWSSVVPFILWSWNLAFIHLDLVSGLVTKNKISNTP